ncbi:MAG: hypothetical protein QOJ15_4488, partial [Bradyrhizobium sp.]|nr:hypothetical protein [Bradyrhizobium sp.]
MGQWRQMALRDVDRRLTQQYAEHAKKGD